MMAVDAAAQVPGLLARVRVLLALARRLPTPSPWSPPTSTDHGFQLQASAMVIPKIAARLYAVGLRDLSASTAIRPRPALGVNWLPRAAAEPAASTSGSTRRRVARSVTPPIPLPVGADGDDLHIDARLHSDEGSDIAEGSGMPWSRGVRSLGGCALAALAAARRAGAAPREFNDSHFHLTNYIQEGTDVRDFLSIMGTRVCRSTLFGIPLQQTWSYANSGDYRADLLPRRPTRRSTTTPSPTPTSPWRTVAAARGAGALRSDDHRLQPRRHVRRRPHPPRAARRFPASSPASASSPSTRSSCRPRSPARRASLTESRRSTACSIFAGEVGAGGHHPQRHGHAVRQRGHRAGLPDADEGVCCAGTRRRRSSGPTSGSAASCTRSQSSAQRPATGAQPEPPRDRGGDARRPDAPPRVLRHLLGRGRQVPPRDTRGHRAARPPVSTGTPIDSCSARTWSHRRTTKYYAVFESYRPLWALLTPDASAEGAQGKLRAAVRRRAPGAGCAHGRRTRMRPSRSPIVFVTSAGHHHALGEAE